MSARNSDRNLLFGILALQMDFISRESLVKAMNDWVLDKEKPLGEILVANESLSTRNRDLLEQMVDAHIEQHAGDPEKSLAALSSVGSVRNDLAAVEDDDVQEAMTYVSMATPAANEDATITHAGPLSSTSLGEQSSLNTRFRIIRPHAEGGLGKVSVAMDRELNREVALKEIKAGYVHDESARTRFTLEAEITGGLEHPGIVPVYGLGHRDDGQPFYAMRFIKGDSLKDACAKYHEDKDKQSASENALEFRKLLGRFIDVCNAIEYAHSRGVLHRDLKPGNIMLGKYGETLVVDWGLAKAIGRDEVYKELDEQTLQPSSTESTPATQMGSALGTPHFMSPEQAAGKLDELGPASDVYSLGATLYYLLVNRSPFTDRNLDLVLAKVQMGEIENPREVDASVSKPLEAICLKAMARDAGERYPTPNDLANDVSRWLADEAVEAACEPIIARARRWTRNHPKTVTTVMASMLIGLLFAIAMSTLIANSNRILAEKNEALLKRERVASALRLSAQARLAGDRHPILGLLLAVEAVHATVHHGEEVVPEAWTALVGMISVPGGIGLPGHETGVGQVLFDPHGEWVIVRSRKLVQVWDLSGSSLPSSPRETLKTTWSRNLSVSPHGRWLLIDDSGGGLEIWDLDKGSLDSDEPDFRIREDFSIGWIGDDCFLGRPATGPLAIWRIDPTSGNVSKEMLTGIGANTRLEKVERFGNLLICCTQPESERVAEIQNVMELPEEQIRAQLKDDLELYWPKERTVFLYDLGQKDDLDPIDVLDQTIEKRITSIWPTDDLQELRGRDESQQMLRFDIADLGLDPGKIQFLSTRGRNRRVRYRLDRDRWIEVQELQTGNSELTKRRYQVSESTDRLWLSVDGSLMFHSLPDGLIVKWDLDSDDPPSTRVELRGHSNTITSWRFSNDGASMITGSEDGTIRIWDIAAEDGSVPSKLLVGHDLEVHGLWISKDSRWIVSGVRQGDSDIGKLRLWDTDSLGYAGEACKFRAHRYRIADAALSPNGKRLVTIDSKGGARLWSSFASDDAPNYQRLRERSAEQYIALYKPLHTARPLARFSNDGRWLWLGSEGEPGIKDQLWYLPGGDSMAELVLEHATGPGGARYAFFSPDSKKFVWCDRENVSYMLELSSHGAPKQTKIETDSGVSVRPLVFSNDSQLLFAESNDFDIVAIDVRSAKPTSFRAALAYCEFLTPSADNRKLIGIGGRRFVNWDLTEDAERISPQRIPEREPLFPGDIFTLTVDSAHGRIAVSCTDGTIVILDYTNQATPPLSLQLRDSYLGTGIASSRTSGKWDKAESLCFSQDGRWLLAGGYGSVSLWDLHAERPGQSVRMIELPHVEEIVSVGWTIGDQQFWAAGSDGMVRFWDTDVRELVSRAKRVAGRELSDAERSAFGLD